MVPTVLHIVSIWGDECYYRIDPFGNLQSLRQSGVWANTHGYRDSTLEGVIKFYTEDGTDPAWSYEWVEEEKAGYASEG